MLARLEAHIEVVTKACVKRTPFAARSSIFGVWIMGLPMQDMVSQRWLSVNKKIMFGGFAVFISHRIIIPLCLGIK